MEPDVVASSYVKSEQGKKASIWLKSEEELRDFDRRTDALEGEELKLEVYRLSEERNNVIYRRLYQSKYSWRFEMLPASILRLPQINVKVNPYLEKVGWELARFTTLVRAHPAEVALEEFGDDGRPVRDQNLLVISESGRYRIFDGSHRAVSMCLRGATAFGCYVGS